MKYFLKYILIFLSVIILSTNSISVTDVVQNNDKKFDLTNYHSVGNIWLRVSNYGFFGSGYAASPQWPSLEYPGGSAIDYLFQGSLWFGAKKVRRNSFNEKLYWLTDPEDEYDCVPQSDPDWTPDLSIVVDTLVTVGYDGRWDVYEFLPAYNPLETQTLGSQYDLSNSLDNTMGTSIRQQRRGIDDDGDGKIDEDPCGYAFPFRSSNELPVEFSHFSNSYLDQHDDFTSIEQNLDIWFPLGFVDLSDESNQQYLFTNKNDDDNDGLFDEDGFPVSEQDFISYYYDYSPFGTSGQRDWGGAKGGNTHYPLNLRVRQLSYQWSYEHIKNLVYVEFNITNMNPVDTLYDCVMGIYMDSDVGPQAWNAGDRCTEDVSSYVPGEGYEFAYTYDADGDQGLTTGYVGSRVCTPDPDLLEFACWYWENGEGPRDGNARELYPADRLTSNEKYWLLSGRNPIDDVFVSLLEGAVSPVADTRYLFGFYGDMEGMTNPSSSSWNLAPGKTMKIVIAIFPGNSIPQLKSQSVWAKLIYGKAQNLENVTQPDTFIHYVGPEPPLVPTMYAQPVDDGNAIDVFWDNRAEIENEDNVTVTNEQIGWQAAIPGIDSYLTDADTIGMPDEFKPENWNGGNYNENALINPWTGFRLRHDFQGYSVWGRSGSGSHEDWILQDRWDKIETDQDLDDYQVNDDSEYFFDFGGEQVIDEGLPNRHDFDNYDMNYYHFNEQYSQVNYEYEDDIYGFPIYNHQTIFSDSLQQYANTLSFTDQALLFKHPDIPEEVFLNLYDEKLIPLTGHSGQAYVENGVEIENHRIDRLSRRYYRYRIYAPPKGIEYYLAVTAWDRGMPEKDLQPLESGRDIDANMRIFIPGPSAKDNMDSIHVVPNPYVGQSKFDGRKENDEKGDKSRRIWFVNIPNRCTIKVFTLAGDLVDVIKHNGEYEEEIISLSKANYTGIAASGLASWDLLSRNNQITAPGVYLYSVKNHENGKIKVGKFVIIK